MKHVFKFYPNEDLMSIYIDKRLSDAETKRYASPVAGLSSELATKLFKVDGVTEVTINQYEIMFEKAKMFNWADIKPNIVQIIIDHLEPKNDSEPVPTTNSWLDLIQRLRKKLGMTSN